MGEGVEVVDRPFAGLLDEALDHATVQRTHELGMRLGQLAERAVGEGDHRDLAVVGAVDRGIEAQHLELSDERLEARRGICVPGALVAALLTADLRGLVGPDARGGGGLQKEPGQKGIRRRLEPERRGLGGQRVPVLGAPHAPGGVRAHVEEADVAHALEVRPHRVGVQPQRLGDVGRREGHGRSGELEIDRVAGVVAERLQDRQPAVGHRPKITRRRPVKSVVMPAGSLPTPHAAPSVEEIFGLLRGVMDPELGGNVVDLGMIPAVDVQPDPDGEAGALVTIEVKLTVGGCPLRAQIKKDIETRIATHPGVRDVRIEWGEMTSEERSEVMLKARWNARENAPDTEIPATTRVLAIASGKGGVGKSSVTVNLAAAMASMGLTVGVLDADIWGFSVPRMLGMSGRLEGVRADDGSGKILPNERRIGDGLVKVVSTGNLVDDEGTALMWRGLMLTKAVEQFLRDVQWGDLDYLLIDMPPGTGDVQMGLARMMPRTDLIIVTTPAVSAQKVAIRAADMARRSFLRVAGVVENMSAFTCDHGETYALFGTGGGQTLADEIGVELLGQIPLEPSVAAAGDAGEPVATAGEGPAADAFRAIARRIVDHTVPPVQMAGCSARLLEQVEKALGPKEPAPC